VKIFYTDHYVLPLPEGYRFPMAKYRLLRKRVEEAGLANGAGLREPHAATDEEILRAHDRDYLERVVSGRLSAQELRRIGFPWTPQIVESARAVPPAPPSRSAALHSPMESA
jgi:acetoin utilization deacetylase AcuC-like enzyme